VANLTVTPAKVGVAWADARLRNRLAGVAINGGDACVVNSSGLAVLSNSGAAGTSQFNGIAIPTKNSGYSAGVGQAVELIEEGEVEGFDLSGLAYEAPVYLSDTAGKLADAAGTKSVVVGRVVPTSERDASGNPRKLLYVHRPYNTVVT
jgi:hypothetical protein